MNGHDPYCPNYKECNHTCGDCLCKDDAFCQCDLISIVRASERYYTVESAVFVASQYGCDHGLLNALNAINGES